KSPIPLDLKEISISKDQPELITSIPVASPAKWDAEHPNLYTLKAELIVAGKVSETIVKCFGFRKIEVVGRKMLVNGKEVKLRGAGQFDSDAVNGRTLFPGEAEEDVKLYKGANMNLARTACYPPSQEFLDAADRYGLYVEEDCPVTFSATTTNGDLTPIY